MRNNDKEKRMTKTGRQQETGETLRDKVGQSETDRFRDRNKEALR